MSQDLTNPSWSVIMCDMETMNDTQYDALMDEAQEMLVKGSSHDETVSHLMDTFGWDLDTADGIVSECERHPITKILIAQQSR